MKRTHFWIAPAAAIALLAGNTPSMAQSAGEDSPSAPASSQSSTASDASTSNTASDAAADNAVQNDAARSATAESSTRADSESVSSAATTDSSQDVADVATDQTEAPATAANASGSASADVDASADRSAATPPAAATGSAPDNAVPRAAGASAQLDADMQRSADQTDSSARATDAQRPDAQGAVQGEANVQGQANVDVNRQAIQTQTLTRGLEFGQATDRGLAIRQIQPNTFFYDSGLRTGDVIVSYGGQPIRSYDDFRRYAVYQPGQRVPLLVYRDGREETIYITYRHEAGYAPAGNAYLGVTFDPSASGGAVVRSVNPNSPADRAGIEPGHVIVAVNGQAISTYRDIVQAVMAQRPGSEIDLAVSHRVTLGDTPMHLQSTNATPALRVESAAVVPATPAVPATPPVRVYGQANQVAPAANFEARAQGAVVRPGDPDGDGRALDGDGRINRREAARAIGGRR